ncbi:MAG: hypothetical protein JSS50_03535 [Proteobacteria bacterium]|nr:hypothetical protein [Pseudomonadota bacterium]
MVDNRNQSIQAAFYGEYAQQLPTVIDGMQHLSIPAQKVFLDFTIIYEMEHDQEAEHHYYEGERYVRQS